MTVGVSTVGAGKCFISKVDGGHMAKHLLTYPVFFFKDLTSFEMSCHEGEQELRLMCQESRVHPCCLWQSQDGAAEGCEGGGLGGLHQTYHMLEGRRKGKLPPTLPGGVRTLRRDEKASLGTFWGKLLAVDEAGERACARSDDEVVTDSRLGKEVQAEKDTSGAVCPRTTTPTPLPRLTGAEAANVQANS